MRPELLLLAVLVAAAAGAGAHPGATNPNQITALPGLNFPINFTMSVLSVPYPPHFAVGKVLGLHNG